MEQKAKDFIRQSLTRIGELAAKTFRTSLSDLELINSLLGP